MGKWIVLLLAAFVALAIIGFLVEAARALVGVAIVVIAVVFAFQFFRRGTNGPPAPPRA
jgi:hypothetical protein